MSTASTPAIALLIEHGVDHLVHTYHHDPRSESFGTEASDALTAHLGVVPQQIFKTLVVKRTDSSLAVAVVPVTSTLSLKSAAVALGTRKVVMATKAEAERSTGYVFGGISPLGQKRPLTTVVDESALQWDRILCSGGRRGLEIELDPRDLVRLASAATAPVATG